MIPSSYLFRNIYHQHWEEPDAPVLVERHRRFTNGLLRPLAGFVGAMLPRRGKPRDRHFGSHAYE
jgi:hypothetical protein